MKKKLLAVGLVLVMALAAAAGCAVSDDKAAQTAAGAEEEGGKKEQPVKVVLNEVAHSIFYAPMYVAIEEGYFGEENIDLDLVCGFGVRRLGQDIL